jgi:transposase
LRFSSRRGGGRDVSVPPGRDGLPVAALGGCYAYRPLYSLAADKAYSNGLCRDYLRRRSIRHTISEKTDSQAARQRKGSRGGRPPGFDEERYKKRNTGERAINRLKQSRAIATRYDKRGYVFLGTVTAAAVVIWLRT